MHRRRSSRIASASSAAASCAPRRVPGEQQPRQAVVEFFLGLHAARGVQARQQRMDAGLFERPGAAWRNVPGDDLHHSASRMAAARGRLN